MKYTKKPVTIEARPWRGTAEDATPIIDWILDENGTANFVGVGENHHLRRKDEFSGLSFAGAILEDAAAFLVIQTLEGAHRADAGDFIIQGVKDEFYPCKPDIFAATYREAVDDLPLSVILRTSDFRGDHAADLSLAHGLLPGESVSDLVRRLLVTSSWGGDVFKLTEHIEIRLVSEPVSTESDAL